MVINKWLKYFIAGLLTILFFCSGICTGVEKNHQLIKKNLKNA